MKPDSVEVLQEIVRTQPCVKSLGGRSKTALSSAGDGAVLEMSGLQGMLEYEPSEYTFTALAGTRLDEVDALLAEHGQYLPFDPPLKARGATLGGTVAAGLSGSGRYRYGGVRDFLLGVKFIDSTGDIARVGGKVVKNAAGFDISKLMVGSLGRYGALVELSFKVFPRPSAYTTIVSEYNAIEPALNALIKVSNTPLDVFALDLEPGPEQVNLLVRIGGLPESLPARVERLRNMLGEVTVVAEEPEIQMWEDKGEFRWQPEGGSFVKVPITPKRTGALDRALSEKGAARRYICGANLAWIAWQDELDSLDQLLNSLGLSGLVILGSADHTRIGVQADNAFSSRVKQALDPLGRWVEA
jgi:glycolate oxidase FAD binding subunit